MWWKLSAHMCVHAMSNPGHWFLWCERTKWSTHNYILLQHPLYFSRLWVGTDYLFFKSLWMALCDSVNKAFTGEKKECHRTAIDILQDYYYRILITNFPNELTRHKLLISLLLVYTGKWCMEALKIHCWGIYVVWFLSAIAVFLLKTV